MTDTKCRICKAKLKGGICNRCGAESIREQLVISAGGHTWLNDGRKNINKFSACKVAVTNFRLIIYKIKPEAEDHALSFFKMIANAIKKVPHISVNLGDIEYVRRYDSKFVIGTRTNEYSVSLSKHKEFHELLAKYYPPD
ncbi:MAG: hypothetical protein FWG83_03145 [Oscillospiraceae bacterium]|nr:hypothetical protein [Oscillospiraceae bacterium]